MTQLWKLSIRCLVGVTILLGGNPFWVLPAISQLLPDSSLGMENSVIQQGVNQQGQPAEIVSGGARRSNNLFHSFQEFNVSNSQRVYFVNPAGVENILSRVTGINPSNINGVLGVLGNANLFLINPNGILFGPNASLDIQGSFIASTASSIQFADGAEFSAINPSAPPLLTISVPVGLQFNGNEKDIIVNSGQFETLNNLFNEIDDAGQSLSDAQVVFSSIPGGTVGMISGALNSSTDIDLYQLFLQEGQPFTATTVGRTNVDTQLFLFDSNGLGVAANEDSAGLQSTVPFYQPFVPTDSGIYYLGISRSLISPSSVQGNIFDAAGKPIGSGAGLPLNAWAGIPGPIINSADKDYTIALNPRRGGLQVQAGKTLALVGGNVRLEGGTLQALDGRVEIAGIAGVGVVGLAQTGQELQLNVPDGLVRANVTLTNDTLINVSARGTGSIAIHAKNLAMTTSSLLAGFAPDLSSIDTKLGGIELDVKEVTQLVASSITNGVASNAIGDVGNINIITGSIWLTNGTGLNSFIFGRGSAGDINIFARDTVNFDYARAFNLVTPTGEGRGGNIRITAGSVSATNISQLATLTQGKGDAGQVEIDARDTVRFDGRDGFFPTAIFSVVAPSGAGQGGDISITTGTFALTNGALLNASTFAIGKNAGSIKINARDTITFDGIGNTGEFPTAVLSRVEGISDGKGGDIQIAGRSVFVTNGAQLSASTLALGDAGNIEIRAGDTVAFDGMSSNQLFASGALSQVSETGSGNGGSINIVSKSLLIANGAELGVSSVGAGNAGSLAVKANAIRLRSQGKISADTLNSGGNIDLRSGVITFRRSSSLTTNAGGTGTGGNINLDATFIVAALNENNDIIANAFQGSGGRITLTAQNILGFDFRTRENLERLLNTNNPTQLDPRNLLTNDVTAFSQANPTIDTGMISIQTPGLDLTQGIVSLPTDLSDPSQLIASTCAADKGNSFAVIGRGGLPEDPRQPLMGQVIWQDKRGIEGGKKSGMQRGNENEQASRSDELIVEARDWARDPNGNIILFARYTQSQRSIAMSDLNCALVQPREN